MTSINVQYLVAGTLLDGRFSFEMAHDQPRLASAEIQALLARTTLTPDPRWAGVRAAELEVTRRRPGGLEKMLVTVTDVRGRPTSPMTSGEVREKALGLMSPVLGNERAGAVCDIVLALESATGVEELARLIR
jgi:2-methylcitrate dehydratase PrpD